MITCRRCAAHWEAPTWTCPDCGDAPTRVDGFPALAPALVNAGFNAKEAAHLAHSEGDNFWFQARNRLLGWALDHYAPAARRLCEVGCGTGYVLSGFRAQRPELDLWGTEISTASLVHARERLPDVHLFQADARDLPFIEHFDVIAICDVLEHIEEDDQVLDQLHKALRPGGSLIVTVPQHTWMWSQADERAGHVRRYTADTIRDVVVGAGFEVQRSTSFVSLLLPLMAASRLRKQRQPARSELQLSGSTNRLLGGVMTAERALLTRGLNWPVGGSRLVIARRLPA